MQWRKPPVPALTVKLSKYNVDDVALGVCKTGAEEAGVTEVRTSLSEKRSEERRVGKECRTRRSAYHSQKKRVRFAVRTPNGPIAGLHNAPSAPDVATGRALFAQAGCANCHGGFFFSSRRRHTRSVSAFLLNRSSDLNRQTIKI